MTPLRWLLALLLAIVAAGCVRADIEPSSPPPVPSPAAPASQVPVGTIEPAPPIPTLEPVPTEPPGPDDRYTPIDTVTVLDRGARIHVAFTGAREFSPDDPCSARYAATTTVAGNVLEIGLRDLRAPGPRTCDALGHSRTLDLDLPVPFTGTSWRDLYQSDLHFLATPPGLIAITPPFDWRLVAEGDADGGPNGRWSRTYASVEGAPIDRSLVVYQAFDAPADVTGGTEEHEVTVAGQPAILYRFPPTGELVLVWMFGSDGLALVADEQVIPVPALIAIAESARAPGP